MKKTVTFEEVFAQNEKRIHYQIHKLNIRDPHNEFYQEGLCAMWNAYEKYDPDKGVMATYFNYAIRNRLIDVMRKNNRENEHVQKYVEQHIVEHTDGNYIMGTSTVTVLTNVTDEFLETPDFWKNLKSKLTENQWKWIRFYVIENLSLKEIAIQENTTTEAVKSWGKQVKKKLRDKTFCAEIAWEVE